METLTEGYGLIEGPVWVPGRGLLFSDVVFGGVFSLTEEGEVTTVFEHRRGIGGMALHERDGMVVSGRNISYKAFAGGDSVVLLDRNEAEGNVGYNDITAGPSGRIYAGSLGSSPVFDDGRAPQAGDLFLIDLDGSSRIVATDIMLTNGLGFSPDATRLYHSDSRRQGIFCYEVEDTGDLGEKQLFAEVTSGAPDGLAVAEDGMVWVALAGGGGVGVFDPAGNLTATVPIPTPMCTSVCFGGGDLKDLYIVSGSDGTGSDRAGAVYRRRCDVAGVPVPLASVPVSGEG